MDTRPAAAASSISTAFLRPTAEQPPTGPEQPTAGKRSAAQAQLDAILQQACVPEGLRSKLEGALLDWKLEEDHESVTEVCEPRHKRHRTASPERPPDDHEESDNLRLRTSDGHEVCVCAKAFSALSGYARDLLESSTGENVVPLPPWLTVGMVEDMCDLSDFYARLAALDRDELGGAFAVGLAASEAEAEFVAALDLSQALGLMRAASFFEAERPLLLAGLSVCCRLRRWPLDAVVDLIPSLQPPAPALPCSPSCVNPAAALQTNNKTPALHHTLCPNHGTHVHPPAAAPEPPVLLLEEGAPTRDHRSDADGRARTSDEPILGGRASHALGPHHRRSAGARGGPLLGGAAQGRAHGAAAPRR